MIHTSHCEPADSVRYRYHSLAKTFPTLQMVEKACHEINSHLYSFAHTHIFPQGSLVIYLIFFLGVSFWERLALSFLFSCFCPLQSRAFF